MSAEHTRRLDILLIEDNPGDARLAKEALRLVGRDTIHWVEDAEAALRFLQREGEYEDAPRPALILLDLNLPGLDGRQLLERLKTNDRLRAIPVVVLTTSSAPEDIQQAYDLHANCYVTKPLDLNEFIESLEWVERFWLSVARLPPTSSDGLEHRDPVKG